MRRRPWYEQPKEWLGSEWDYVFDIPAGIRQYGVPEIVAASEHFVEIVDVAASIDALDITCLDLAANRLGPRLIGPWLTKREIPTIKLLHVLHDIIESKGPIERAVDLLHEAMKESGMLVSIVIGPGNTLVLRVDNPTDAPAKIWVRTIKWRHLGSRPMSIHW